jgi:hypothetical protein
VVLQLLVERDDVETDSKDNNGETPLFNVKVRGHNGGS